MSRAEIKYFKKSKLELKSEKKYFNILIILLQLQHTHTIKQTPLPNNKNLYLKNRVYLEKKTRV